MMRQPTLTACAAVGIGVLLLSNPEPAGAQQRATPTREVAPPGREPYSTLFFITVPNGNGSRDVSPDPVPANKRLVIEFVHVRVTLDPAETPLFVLEDLVNGAGNPFILPLTRHMPGDHLATQLVRLYHDGNGVNGPAAQCIRAQNSFNSMTCTISISGYLIDR